MILHSDWLADIWNAELAEAGLDGAVVVWTIWAVDYNAGSEWEYGEEQDATE